MKGFPHVVDQAFLLLLILESAIVGICFLDLAPGAAVTPPLPGPDGWNLLPAAVSSLQLACIGTLLFTSIRRPDEADEGPSAIFLLLSGLVFLLLALKRTAGPLCAAGDIPCSLPPILVLVAVACRAGRRSFAVIWTRFHREAVIILAGIWLHLFGAVGMEILHLHFLRNGSVPDAGKAFFEMAGGTVILYGVILFRRQRCRWDSRLAVA
jgi:hypothetical protein